MDLTLKSQSLEGVLRLVERGSPKYDKATLRWPAPVSRRSFATAAALRGARRGRSVATRGDLGIEQ
jgi:hypothetical protein